MYTVYLLYSIKYGKTYVGFTADIASRLASHNELGHKGWTKKFRPWELVYQEDFETKDAAMRREKWFKTGVGRERIKVIIAEWLEH